MSFAITTEGAGYRLSFREVVVIDELRRGFERLRDTGLGDETPHVIVDFVEVDSIEMSIEDHHRMHLALRTMFSRGPDFRVALVVASERVRNQLGEAMAVRDLLTGRSPGELPRVGFFDSVDEARDWVAAGES